MAGNRACLDVFPHQQLWPYRSLQFAQQLPTLLGTGRAAHQHRGTAELDDALQARRRQARVQWQVAGTGLEAADDHAQQRQTALGQQCHRLIHLHTSLDQGVAQAVGRQVQPGVVVRRFQAAGHGTFRMRGNLRFEQRNVTVLQRVVAVGAVAVFQQEALFFCTQQRQFAYLTLEALHQRQQQALELGQQALDGREVEVALVERQVQAKVVARVAHRRQREVGVGTARIGTGIQVLGMIEHGGFHRGVLEHEQAVEQRLAFGQLAALLNRHQRQVFVLAQLHVALQQALQPLAHTAALTGYRQLHAQGNAVDEQADGALHLRHAQRAPGHGHAKGHIAVAAVTRQHQGPGRLGEGVDGELVGLGQFAQAHAITDVKAGVAITHHHAAASVVMAQRAVTRDGSGALETGEVGLPPGACVVQALALQPADVVAVARRHRQLGLTAFAKGLVHLEEVVHQQRAAPGIDQDVVVAHHEPVALVSHAHQAQVERCLAEQGEPGLTLLLVQGLQALFLGIVREAAPVLIVHRQVARLVNDLQHRLAAVPAERCAQRFMARHHGLPGLGESLGVQGAVDAVAVLHVVQARARLQQGVQQHAFLHRRQRVDVFDLCSRYRQRVDLLLSQMRQREVRRGEAAVAIGQAMGDQRQQFLAVGFGQRCDGAFVVAFGTERPAQLQGTAIHLAIDAQPVGQRCVEVMRQAGRGFQWLEQRRAVELLVELAQVVEGDARLRQGRHLLAPLRVGQVAQHAIAQAFVRHLAQLFLDALDRTGPRRVVLAWLWAQAERIRVGEPADAAGEVHVFE